MSDIKAFHSYAKGRRITREELLDYCKDRDIELIDELDGLKVGDKVTFTNDYGVEFPGMTVLAIKKVDDYLELSPGHVFYTNSDAYWFPKKRSELTLEA